PTVIAPRATLQPRAETEQPLEPLQLAPDDPAALMRWLASFELVVNPGAEDDDELPLWSFADLLFHTRSRVGRNLGGYGGSYRFESATPPLPAIKPVTGETIEPGTPRETAAPRMT